MIARTNFEYSMSGVVLVFLLPKKSHTFSVFYLLAPFYIYEREEFEWPIPY